MSGGMAQLFLNLGTRRGCVVSIRPRPPLPPGKDLIPIVQEAGWAPELVWIGAENLAPPGSDSQTFEPVASRYTDCNIPAPHHTCSQARIYAQAPGRQIFRGSILKKSRLKYGMREKKAVHEREI